MHMISSTCLRIRPVYRVERQGRGSTLFEPGWKLGVDQDVKSCDGSHLAPPEWVSFTPRVELAGIKEERAVLRSSPVVLFVGTCTTQGRLEMGCQTQTPSFGRAGGGYRPKPHRQF